MNNKSQNVTTFVEVVILSIRLINSRKVPLFLLSAIMILWGGCTYVHQERCGDLHAWRYGYRSAGLSGARFERSELHFALKTYSRKTFAMSDCIERSIPLPNMLAIRIPNIRDVVPSDELSGPGYKRKLIDLVRPLPYSNVVVRLNASRSGRSVAQNEIDFSSPNWYVAIIDNHDDGIAARPLFPKAVEYDELTVEVVRDQESADVQAIALFSVENRREFEQMIQLNDGRRAILETLPESYLLNVRDRPLRWPPRWLKLEPGERTPAKRGRMP